MSLDEQAEVLALELEQGYLEGGLPRMITLLVRMVRELKGTTLAKGGIHS